MGVARRGRTYIPPHVPHTPGIACGAAPRRESLLGVSTGASHVTCRPGPPGAAPGRRVRAAGRGARPVSLSPGGRRANGTRLKRLIHVMHMGRSGTTARTSVLGAAARRLLARRNTLVSDGATTQSPAPEPSPRTQSQNPERSEQGNQKVRVGTAAARLQSPAPEPSPRARSQNPERSEQGNQKVRVGMAAARLQSPAPEPSPRAQSAASRATRKSVSAWRQLGSRTQDPAPEPRAQSQSPELTTRSREA